ncbi:uncharacterized protein VP01_4609g1, partial [Puccinia sorghi]
MPVNSIFSIAFPSPSSQASTHPEVEALFDCVIGDKGKSADPRDDQGNASANNPSIVINPPTPVPSQPSKQTSTSTKAPRLPTSHGSTFDKELFKKFLLFTKMMQALTPVTPPSKPTLRELLLVLYKWLPNVPNLNVNGDNFQTWVVMVQQALEGGPIVLMDNDLVLQSDEDMLLKMALLATINDSIKVRVAELLSCLEGFRLISNTFTLRSRTSHIAVMKQLLDLKFNHLDQTADLDAHFRKIENMGPVSKWCHKCKVNTHYTQDCFKSPTSGSVSSNNAAFCPSITSNSNPFRSATAPPRSNFQVHHSGRGKSLVGKMKIKNKSGSITLNNVYYSPDASCTLLSAETLRLGGGRIE